ncbi:MATE family efflux transporter [Pseudoxanthomonas sp. JBR18]|uniref:MATE family efflux transporter n=1 Tax=Pseudoxanthomonas sp. JBR18 TaxID=2969308 RepID=UPI0023058A0A|nr:MATE family efflux transporter [Pseudoxanthomonas sp. JBR18]WCE03259.1 MATE family efflux transporter [Pseudoxanthomonas sp. JBR18]
MSARPASRSLVEGPIGRNLLLFSLPILGGNVAQSLNGSVNAVWIGKFLGESALTAAANANSILFFLIGSVFGIGMAATILIGQAIGAGDTARARRVMGTSASFFIGLSVVIACCGVWLARHLLSAMGTPADALPLAEAYLRVIFLAMPLIYAFAFLSAALRGVGDAKTPLRYLLLAVAMDCVLDPMLMLGVGPFPKLGIAGAAWSTLVTQAIALAAMLVSLRRRGHVLWLGRKDLHLLRIDPAILKALVTKGVPMGLQMVLVSLAMIAMMTLVNRFGTDIAAAYGAALQTWNYVQMPAMAIAAAASSMAAQNVGAGRWDRVSATARTGVLFNFLMTGALIAPLILLDHWTFGLFLESGSPAFDAARHLNHIAIWSFLFFGVMFVLSGVVRSTGAVIVPLIILVISLWGIRVPFAKLLQPTLGSDAIWWSFPTSSLCSMLLSIAYYRWGGWRKAQMMNADASQVAIPSEVPARVPSPVADPAEPDYRPDDALQKP